MTFRSSTAAPQRAATTQRIDVARELLLTPFGLDEGHLARALAEIRAHQVDDADLYFQYTRSEGWSLEEGIVKTGSFSIDQGVGVRAVSGEKTAFAYSDDISEASLLDAARTVRSISSVAQGGRVRVRWQIRGIECHRHRARANHSVVVGTRLLALCNGGQSWSRGL